MTRFAALAMSLLLTLSAIADGGPSRLRPDPRTVRLMVPTFAGEKGIGANVSTILNLQTWRTLRVPRRAPSTFGEVVRDEPLPALNPKSARWAADRNGSHLILWGKAFRYADETIVQAYLDIPPRQDISFQEWSVEIVTPDQRHWQFAADLPSRSYEFEPIVLPNSVVDRYTAIDALKIYASPRGEAVKGVIADRTFRATHDYGRVIEISYRDSDARSEYSSGYIRVPELANINSEIADFTGGMIRILRQDWNGARELLTQTALRPGTPTSVRIDAYLLLAMSLAKSDSPWSAEAARAEDLNPYLQSTARYLIMFRLYDLSKAYAANDEHGVTQIFNELVSFVERKRSFFDADDKLISAIDRFVSAQQATAERH